MRLLNSFAPIVVSIALLSLPDVTKGFFPTNDFFCRSQNQIRLSLSASTSTTFVQHSMYLQNVAKAVPPPKLELLLQLLELTDDEEIVSPTSREGMNPFLIPLSKSKTDGGVLCYIRWPTQKESMDLQLVRTTDVGIYLVAMGTDQYCHRLAVEQDFFCLPTAGKAIELLNASGQVEINYVFDYYIICSSLISVLQDAYSTDCRICKLFN